jgi:N-acetylneuraminic acid mutarotase
VLIAGGFWKEGSREISISSAEVYDPVTNTFTPAGDLNEPRNGHTATLLPDGKVLIVGGWGLSQRSGTAELFDPQTGRFTYTTSLSAPRAGMTATLLEDGRVLIIGGESARNAPQLVAELYDPALKTFVQAATLNVGRFAHTATRILDGSVLVIGGSSKIGEVLASAELYDPTSNEFRLAGSMSVVRHKHAAALLQDGRVLVLGGSDQRDWQGNYASAEIYDPKTDRFEWIASMNEERFKLADAVVTLQDGSVLVGGGNRQLESYNPESGRFTPVGRLDNHYYSAVLTLLKDGRVLITGGYDPNIQPTSRAWIFN